MTLCTKKSLAYIIVLSGLTLVAVELTYKDFLRTDINVEDNQTVTFLLDSPSCRIVNHDPFSRDVVRLFKPIEFEPCSEKKHLLTRVSQLAKGRFALIIQKEFEREYFNATEGYLACCYQVVTRETHGNLTGSSFRKSNCYQMEEETFLDQSVEFILVTCKVKLPHSNSTRVVYQNGHAIVPVKRNVQIRLENFKSNRAKSKIETPPSILMFGIDSVSRLNYRRVMPLTLRHLYSSGGWVELNIFNKVGLNTFPNFMALLGGYQRNTAYGIRDSKTFKGLDSYSLIWNDFRDKGYVTALCGDCFSELLDSSKETLCKQPTDYYVPHYTDAMGSTLPVKMRAGLNYCFGPVTDNERIMQYMTDFTTAFSDYPYFGIFWMTSLCHDTIDMPPSMDLKIKQTFIELSIRGILNNSIIFFFSDHGLRFGPVRELPTGAMEDSLPFMHIWIPEKFRTRHPAFFANLVENSNKLTSHFDIYMTLQHILSLSSNYTEQPAEGCPQCSSIFKPIPFNRSCVDAGINTQWCACNRYTWCNIHDEIIRAAAEYSVLHINNILKGENQCSLLKLKQLKYAQTDKIPNGTTTSFHYFIEFKTIPGDASFYSTVKVNANKEFEIQGTIIRSNQYENPGCIKSDLVRLPYCHCRY